MRYIPHTEEDVARMLRVIGAPSVDALFSHIPAALRHQAPLDIEPLDEATLLHHLGELGGQSLPAVGATVREGAALSFLGAGVVAHHIPAMVDMLLMRAEWYTSYTPYQPEISQGTLQAIFEFQTLVSELFGPQARPGEPAAMIANASMYDGATATVEGVLMAQRVTGRGAVLVGGAVHPQYEATLRCYLAALHAPGEGGQLFHVGYGEDGRIDLQALRAEIARLGKDLGCVLVQTPNYLGVVEDLRPIAQAAHEVGALLVTACTEPVALGVLRSPGALGADIVCGEGLGLAIPPSLGGPGVGLFAARTEHLRQLPGRLVGETVDQSGKRGFVLTLSTREQHIRREKATSNICTNQGLIALAFTIHLCTLGRRGFAQLAAQNLARASYAKARLAALPGFRLAVNGPTFNEFALRVRGGKAALIVERLAERNLLAGVPLTGRPDYELPSLPGADEVLLVAVSERHRKEDIERLAKALDEVCP